MKELSIEEKAKRYDEAYRIVAVRFGSNIADEIFLKESEDERIRQELICFLTNLLDQGGMMADGWDCKECEEYIVWLEKQGEQKPITHKYNVGATIYYNSFGETKSMLVANVVDNGDGNPMYEDANGNAVFEKELVEQKPDDVKEPNFFDDFRKTDFEIEPKFKVGDTVTVKPMSCHGKVFKGKPFKIVDIIEDNYVSDDGKTYSISLQNGWELVEQESQLKFKEGDWIINGHGFVMQITKVKAQSYQYCYDGKENECSIEQAEKSCRLWTIQDAKDGDVLSYRDGQWIFIYKGFGKEENEIAYYALLSDEGLTLNNYNYSVLESAFSPATKEERDTLEKAMSDAGYIFNFEKKELRKIGQKPAWSEEDENRINRLIAYFEDKESFTAEDDVVYANWLKYLKDRVQPQPRKEWSNEEKNRISRIIAIIRNSMSGTPDDILWLKSLRPQNWNKEDKERYISCLQRLGTGNPEQPETINSKWFKEHVYPQSTWKPSEEQIKAIKEAACYSSVFSEKTIDNLISLSKQLKKLREALL